MSNFDFVPVVAINNCSCLYFLPLFAVRCSPQTPSVFSWLIVAQSGAGPPGAAHRVIAEGVGVRYTGRYLAAHQVIYTR